MDTVLHSGDMNIKTLGEITHQWDIPADALAMVFDPAEWRFCRADELEDGFIERSERGRFFSPQGELRWRSVNSGLMRTVYLGENPPQGLEDCSSKLNGLRRAENTRRFLLWGVRTPGENEWIEQQAPHRFRYPCGENETYTGGGERIALVVQDWVDNASIPHFSRYHSLEIQRKEDK